jgi:predicted nuclease of restriction endonuclease-like (RecB) superfamily
MNEIIQYTNLLTDIKKRIQQAQSKAILAANSEMISMYWDIGRMLSDKQKLEGWGAGVVPRLAKDIINELPEQKGFSERNIKFMVQLYKEYEGSIGKQPVSQLDQVKHLVSQIPWGHNIILMQRLSKNEVRFWYMKETLKNGWSRDTLVSMVKSDLYSRQGQLTHNFNSTLPLAQNDLVRQALKDPYIFDFLTMSEPFAEREIEVALVKHLEKFLIGFSSSCCARGSAP